MTDLKLGKLPDRTPVKITFTAGAELNKSLQAYAGFYKETYGQDEPVPELVPFMLEAFLRSDAAFKKAQRGKQIGPHPGPVATRRRGAEANRASSVA